MIQTQIDNNFSYHAPKPGQPEKYEIIRSTAKCLAELVNEACPESREKSLALTKLDVLDDQPVIKICTAYERDDGVRYDTFPSDLSLLARCKPVYEEMPGWMTPTSHVTRYEDLPLKARAYVERLVSLIGGRLGILSVGPERETTLRMGL